MLPVSFFRFKVVSRVKVPIIEIWEYEAACGMGTKDTICFGQHRDNQNLYRNRQSSLFFGSNYQRLGGATSIK